ncbi:hypothetical protein ACVOMV_09790 [Mesorhizobium atlanticum]
MPRKVKIHRNTAAMLPFVSPCLGETWNAEGEQAVSLDRLAEIIRVEDVRARPIAAASSSCPLGGWRDKARAHAEDSMPWWLWPPTMSRTGTTGLLPLQKRRMATIAALVKTVPTVHAGSRSKPGGCGRVDSGYAARLRRVQSFAPKRRMSKERRSGRPVAGFRLPSQQQP